MVRRSEERPGQAATAETRRDRRGFRGRQRDAFALFVLGAPGTVEAIRVVTGGGVSGGEDTDARITAFRLWYTDADAPGIPASWYDDATQRDPLSLGWRPLCPLVVTSVDIGWQPPPLPRPPSSARAEAAPHDSALTPPAPRQARPRRPRCRRATRGGRRFQRARLRRRRLDAVARGPADARVRTAPKSRRRPERGGARGPRADAPPGGPGRGAGGVRRARARARCHARALRRSGGPDGMRRGCCGCAPRGC